MGFPGMWELLIVLAIVLIIFGPKRLKTIGSDIGNAIKGFRSAVGEDKDQAEAAPDTDPSVIEGKVETETSAEKKQDSNV